MRGKSATTRALLALFALQVCLIFGGGAAPAQEIGNYARVHASALNLRAAPGTGARVLRALPFGTTVSILDRRGSWARVFVQDAGGKAAEGWVAARFLGQVAATARDRRRPAYGGHAGRPGHPHAAHRAVAPLRVSKLDFDCRPALFGSSGIRKCVASARVQLSPPEFDPDRSDHVFIACRGAISYRTERGHGARRLSAVQRASIARDDRLGQSVRVSFPVRSEKGKIVSADLVSFSCGRD